VVKQSLEQSPNDVEGLNLLGMIYNEQGKYDEAVATFQQASTIAPSSADTLVNLATSYANQNKNDLAAQTLRKALRLQPGKPTANYNLANLLLGDNKPKEALSYLLRIAQPDAATRLLTIRAYLDSGATPAGSAASEKLSRDFPKDVKIHFSLGVLLASHRKYRQAAYEFEKADALQPGSFDILHDLGRAYFLSGDLAKAQETFSHALHLQPDSADTLYWLAQTTAAMQKDVDALELLVRARKLAPTNMDILFLMAQLSMKQSFFEDAIEVLDEGLKIDPRRGDFRAALGESYFTIGKVDKALEQFKTLVSLDPSPRSYVFMALCYRHLGQYDDAKRYFNQSLSADPKNLPALFNLGFIARKQGDYARAEQYLERALSGDKDYPEPLFELASLKMDQKKYAEAVPLLRHFVEVSPNPTDGYYKLALAERSLHQMDAAQRDMNVFKTLSKSPQPAPYPLQHFFDYLERRSLLTTEQQNETDLRALEAEVQQHPDRPRGLYLLAESLLKVGRSEEAVQALQRLDALSGEDFRTELNSGILLGRFHLYADAIRYLQTAVKINPTSDEAKYNLGEALFRSGNLEGALQALLQVSSDGRKDSSYLGLLGDVYARMGRYADASKYLEQATAAAPDDDQYYASLAGVEVRAGEIQDAEHTVRGGLAHVPDSGLLNWMAGVVAVARGHAPEAEAFLKKASQLSPSREAVAATLGIFYYEEGRFSDAREVLKRCIEMFPQSTLDFQKINGALDAAATSAVKKSEDISPQSRREFYELALALRDQEQ
jgi:tetratricopeptide (TPR) repeat protein